MYDVFVSFTRAGHPELAIRIRDILDGARIPVFIDERLPVAEGISDGIVRALQESRILVVVYSASYNDRWACQWELMQAYLAGSAEGSPGRRIVVVNPERGTDHITQTGVADQKFLTPDQLGSLVTVVRRKLAQVAGPMGPVQRLAKPRWLPPEIPGVAGFTGRFTDLWAVHNVLGRDRLPMAGAATADGAGVITGLPGIGKTSLATAYGWLFGSAYPGGVFRVTAGAAGGVAAARDRFASGVRQIAGHLRIATSGESAEGVIDLVAENLAGQPGPSLWIVDDLPGEVDATTLGQFVIPDRSARTLFTARSWSGSSAQEIPLRGVSEADGLAILQSARPFGAQDRAAAALVVDRLGGHPLALSIVAAQLRDAQGLISYQEYGRTLTGDTSLTGIVAAIGQSMSGLQPADRLIVLLAGLAGGVPLPAALTGAVLGAADPPLHASASEVSEALSRLCRGGFASRDGRAWRIHPLVAEAAARAGPPPAGPGTVAALAARELAGLLAASPDDVPLAGYAQALADCAELTDEALADGLRRQVAGYQARAGDFARAAALWHEVAGRNPHSAADAVAAARACADNGEFGRAVSHAQEAARRGAAADLAVQADWALAAGLDGLGRFGDAEPIWARLAVARWDPEPAQRIALDVARARALLARGRLGEARSILEPLQDIDAAAHADLLNAARIELARLRQWTSREREARELADSVVRYYQDRNAPGHALCLEAELVWAEAAVSLGLFELRPDTREWARAEGTAARLAQEYPRLAGSHSAHGLAAAVLRGLVLVWLGKQHECREVLEPVVPAISERLGERHPLALRARYALGLAHLQLGEHQRAAEVLGAVWEAQRTVIGPGHPDTLHSQLQYGVALKLVGGGPAAARSAEVITGVIDSMPAEIGRRNDLYAQAQLARSLRYLPGAAITGLMRIDRLLGRNRDR